MIKSDGMIMDVVDSVANNNNNIEIKNSYRRNRVQQL